MLLFDDEEEDVEEDEEAVGELVVVVFVVVVVGEFVLTVVDVVVEFVVDVVVVVVVLDDEFDDVEVFSLFDRFDLLGVTEFCCGVGGGGDKLVDVCGALCGWVGIEMFRFVCCGVCGVCGAG